MPLQSLPMLVIWGLVPLCYYAGAKLGVAVALMPEGIAILWPPNSVLITAMLLRPSREMPVIAALGVATEIVADLSTFSVTEAAVFGVANAVEATVATLLLKAWRFDPRLSTLADLSKFLWAGPAIAALLAAAGGAAVYAQIRTPHGDYFDLVRIWWLGDALGLLIFAPLLLTLALRQRGSTGAARWRTADVLVAALGVVITAVLAFSRGGTVGSVNLAPVLVIPCLVYLATRFELRVVSAAVSFVGLAIAYAAAHGRDPFGALPPTEQSLRTQEFIFILGLLTLGLSALLGQLRQRQAELHQANERLDQLNRDLELRVAERTAQLDQSNRQLQQLAMTDALTGIANRRAFFAAANAIVETALRHGRPVSLVMIDIDHFKAINDRHGHAAGDEVLRHVAHRLQHLLRSSDCLARYGGEEFVLLAPEIEVASALALARRMGDALRASPLVLGGASIQVTASFGVSALGVRGDTLERLIQRADAALYESKRSGRDRALAVEA